MKQTRNFPKIRKEIKDFLFCEEGKMNKKDILKIGLSLSILSTLFIPAEADAACTSHFRHANSLFSTGRGGHSSASPHTQHCSHTSHGSW